MIVMDAYGITDYDIQALVDNELTWEDEKRVRAHLKNNPEAEKRYQELMLQRKSVRGWWKRTQKYN